MTSLLALIVLLGVLIFVHELGHFLAARSVGIAVLRFSFGLGPVTPLRKKIGETEYALSWVPFGGYVKMAGAEDDEAAGLEGGDPDAEALAKIPPERMFDHKPLWARIYVISAGVIMNGLFALVVYTALAWHYGVPKDTTTTIARVNAQHLPMGAAGLASITVGDRITRIDGDSVGGWDDVVEQLLTSNARPMRIELAGKPPVMVDVPLSNQDERAQLVQALVPAHEPVLGDVVPGDSADKAGLKPGDRILRAEGDSVVAWEQFFDIVEAHPGQALPLVVRHADGRVAALTVTPRVELHAPDAPGKRVGKIGVAVKLSDNERVGPVGALQEGVSRCVGSAGQVVFAVKSLILGRLSARDIGGPILIGQMSGQAARLGLPVFLGFMAFFSVNLAVLNLLPIPVLDGGHLLFLVIEGVRRRPLSVDVRQKFMTVGLVIVLALMVLAIYNDVMRVIG